MNTDNLKEFLHSKALGNLPEMEDDWAVLNSKIDMAKKRKRVIAGFLISAPVIAALFLFINLNNTPNPETVKLATNGSIISKPQTPNGTIIITEKPKVEPKATTNQKVKAENKKKNKQEVSQPVNSSVPPSNKSGKEAEDKAESIVSNEKDNAPNKTEEKIILVEAEKIVETNEVKKEETVKPQEEEVSKEKQGQKIKIKGKKDFYKGKWYVQVSASPKLAFRNFGLNIATDNKVHKNYQDLRDASEKIRFAYNVGAAIEYFISPKLSVQTGLQYALTGENAKYDFDKTEAAVVDPNTGLITGYKQLSNSQTVTFNSNNSYKFIKVPVMLGYNLGFSDNSSFHFASGISYNILSGVSGYTLDKVSLEKKPLDKRSSELVSKGFDYNLGFGFSYALNHRYGLIFDMYFNKTLNNISADEITIVKPYSSGVNIALSRKLY